MGATCHAIAWLEARVHEFMRLVGSRFSVQSNVKTNFIAMRKNEETNKSYV